MWGQQLMRHSKFRRCPRRRNCFSDQPIIVRPRSPKFDVWLPFPSAKPSEISSCLLRTSLATSLISYREATIQNVVVIFLR
jgi:hypothetical protein